MKIRVLHIVGIMNMGGLENLIMNIYRNIDRSKIQFDFLVTREEEGVFDQEIRYLGGKIYNIPHMSKVGINKYKKNIYDFFVNHPEYSIVHCHRDALCSLYLRQAKKAKIPVRIAHSHNIALSEDRNIKGLATNIIKKYYMCSTNQMATYKFACSKEAGMWLFGKKNIFKNFKVINNGIDTDKYIYKDSINIEKRKELYISESTLLIGHVGRFELQKNHDSLIDIFYKVQQDIDDCKLVLVGSGSLEKEIKEKVELLKLEHKVIFLGIRNDINELMMSFDIFTFPSLFEGLGIVLIEAQTTGLQCIASDTIPKESDMNLGLIDYADLKKINQWVEHIKSINESKTTLRKYRSSKQEKIKNKGYDILSIAKYVQEFYIQNNNNINI